MTIIIDLIPAMLRLTDTICTEIIHVPICQTQSIILHILPFTTGIPLCLFAGTIVDRGDLAFCIRIILVMWDCHPYLFLRFPFAILFQIITEEPILLHQLLRYLACLAVIFKTAGTLLYPAWTCSKFCTFIWNNCTVFFYLSDKLCRCHCRCYTERTHQRNK